MIRIHDNNDDEGLLEFLTAGETGTEFLERSKTVRLDSMTMMAVMQDIYSTWEANGASTSGGTGSLAMVVEVAGNAGTGKTDVVYQMMAPMVLPRNWGTRTGGVGGIQRTWEIGGQECGVAFVDCDGHFSVFRFVAIMSAELSLRLERCVQDGAAEDVVMEENEYQELIQEALKRVTVFRPMSSLELLMVVNHLEQLTSQRPYLKMICVDSLSAFNWMDASVNNSPAFDQAVKILKQLQAKYRLHIVATRQVAKFLSATSVMEGSETLTMGKNSCGVGWEAWSQVKMLLVHGPSRADTAGKFLRVTNRVPVRVVSANGRGSTDIMRQGGTFYYNVNQGPDGPTYEPRERR
jgi:RecA/RadA recombinase